MADLSGRPAGTLATPGSDRRAHGYWRTNLVDENGDPAPVEITTAPLVVDFSVPVFPAIIPDGYDGTPPWYDPDATPPRILNPEGRMFDARIEWLIEYERPDEAACDAWVASRFGLTLPRVALGPFRLNFGGFEFAHWQALHEATGPASVVTGVDLDGPAADGPLDEITPHMLHPLPGTRATYCTANPYFGGENMRTYGAAETIRLEREHPARVLLHSAKLFLPDRSAADELTTGT